MTPSTLEIFYLPPPFSPEYFKAPPPKKKKERKSDKVNLKLIKLKLNSQF